jgi:hypothetical protein
MDIEKQIAYLLATAEPLRALDDDDPRKEELGGIVEQINVLRAQQSGVVSPAVPDAPTVDPLAVSKSVADQEELAMKRAELEDQADELGIKYDGRTTDAALQRRVDEALAK